MRYVIAYDITDDNRRKKLYDILMSYGAWKEYSVFEIKVDKTTMLELENKIKKLIEENEDKVRVYPMCKSCEKKIEDWGKSMDKPKNNIV